jgi:DNA replication regulator SLD3
MVVIERIGDCIYSMCTLKKDLKIKDIRTVAKTAKDLDQRTQTPDGNRMQVDGDEWWRRMVVREPQRREEQDLNLNFLIDDGISEYLFIADDANDRPNTDKDSSMDTSELVPFKRYDSEFSADSGYVSSPQDPFSQATTSVISQYLEALYSTKTSLAYFAKSALSRARSEFQRARSSPDSQSLASFLHNMVLKEEDFNTKYETFLPSLIGDEMECAPWIITDEERNHLIEKFRPNGGEEHEINQSTLQREINELKIREYHSYSSTLI